ncbi:MAG TPA: type II secretion system F family protein [Nevskiaceae bacterium]|nr:type II secretion system F family protein [Nevskiaceae bacterium]
MSAGAFAVLAAFACLLMVAAVFAVALLVQRTRGESKLQRRFEPELAGAAEFEIAGQKPLITNIARGGKAIEGWVDPENESARLMVQAGWRSDTARAMWYVVQALVPLAGFGSVVLYWALGPEQHKSLFLLLFAFVAFALSMLIPRWILRGAAGSRRDRIKGEVPLFIHLLVLLFEAGLSTRQAIASLVREGAGVLPILGGEFELVLRQLEAGGDTSEVLKNLTDMLMVDDLTSAIGVLRQVDRYGGEVREPLLEALAVLEQRRGLDLREKVNLLSGRMTVVMVLFFFPALLIFVAGPAFLSIIRALHNVSH